MINEFCFSLLTNSQAGNTARKITLVTFKLLNLNNTQFFEIKNDIVGKLNVFKNGFKAFFNRPEIHSTAVLLLLTESMFV